MKIAAGWTLALTVLGIHGHAAECPPIANLSEHLVGGRVFLLGELHGTEQSPAFVRAVACASVEAGLETVVGLELTSSAQSMADRYLASKGTPDDREALLSHAMWTRSYQDGRNSAAMVDLIEAVRTLRAEGHRVSVLFFDASSAAGGQDREARMAARLAESIAARPESVHVVLTGNMHSRITRGNARDAGYAPMGHLLGKQISPHHVLALDVAHEGGSAWICTPACGVVELAGRHGGARWSIEIDEGTRPSGHRGWYHVGTLSASVPAVGDHEPPIESPVPVEPVSRGVAESIRRTTEPEGSPLVNRLQGRWQAYRNGLKSWTIEFEGLAFFAEVGPDDWYRGKFYIRPGEAPAEIDFLIEDCVCGYKGESSDAIYRWDGETITLGAPRPGTRRPTFFNEQKGEVVNLVRIAD